MESKYYRKHAMFILNHMPEGEAAEVIDELNALLSKMDCGAIEVVQHQDSCDNSYYPVMHIELSTRAANAYNRRKAGRKRKDLASSHHYTVDEVKAMLETKTADEVAAELGISRSTLFRRLKDRFGMMYF